MCILDNLNNIEQNIITNVKKIRRLIDFMKITH